MAKSSIDYKTAVADLEAQQQALHNLQVLWTGRAYKLPIPSTAKLTLLTVIYLADKHGYCEDSVLSVCGLTGLKERATRYALKDLCQRNVLKRVKRFHPVTKKRLSNGYILQRIIRA